MLGIGRVLSGGYWLEARVRIAVVVIPEEVFTAFIIRNLWSVASLGVTRTGSVSHTTTAGFCTLGPSSPFGPAVSDTLFNEAFLRLESTSGTRVRIVARAGAVTTSCLNAARSTRVRARRPTSPTSPTLAPRCASRRSLLGGITVIVVVAVPIPSVPAVIPRALYLGALIATIFLKGAKGRLVHA